MCSENGRVSIDSKLAIISCFIARIGNWRQLHCCAAGLELCSTLPKVIMNKVLAGWPLLDITLRITHTSFEHNYTISKVEYQNNVQRRSSNLYMVKIKSV